MWTVSSTTGRRHLVAGATVGPPCADGEKFVDVSTKIISTESAFRLAEECQKDVEKILKRKKQNISGGSTSGGEDSTDDEPLVVPNATLPVADTRDARRSRFFVFTENNPADIQQPFAYDEKKMVWLVYQLEQGEQAKVFHWQGAVYFRHAVSFATMKRLLPRGHIESAKGTPEEVRKYCTKNETRVRGPFEFGSMPRQGKLLSLTSEVVTIDQIPKACQYWRFCFCFFLPLSLSITNYG